MYKLNIIQNGIVRANEYYGAAEPPVFCYLACAGSKPYTSLIEGSVVGSMLSI